MLLIGQLAKETGISIGTIRFYEEKGILEATTRDDNNNRLFDEEALKWLTFVKYLRKTGMSIKNIQHYRKLLDAGKETIPERIRIIEQQKQKVLAEIADKQEQIAHLDHKLERYRQGHDNYV